VLAKWMECFVAWNVRRHEKAIKSHHAKREAWLRVVGHPAGAPAGARHESGLESVYQEEEGVLVYREGCFDGARTRVMREDTTLTGNAVLESQRAIVGDFECTRPQLLRLCEVRAVDIDLSSALLGMGVPTDSSATVRSSSAPR